MSYRRVAAAAALFVSLLGTSSLIAARGMRTPFLYTYVSFDGYFSIADALLRCVLTAAFGAYCLGLGYWLARRIGVGLPWSFCFGLGLVFINILLLPLFFLSVMNLPALSVLFAILSAPAGAGILEAKSRKADGNLWGLVIVAAVPLAVHALDALMPVDYRESCGDAANFYLMAPMQFAAAQGVAHSPLLTSVIAGLANFELLGSSIITIANPDAVKTFGFLLFIAAFFMLVQFFKHILRSRWYLWPALLFLLSPFFMDKNIFSFTHPRVYSLFLSQFALFLIFIGWAKREARYIFIALIALGLLSGTNYQGLLCAAAYAVLIVAVFKTWEREWKRFCMWAVMSFAIAMAFPCWAWIDQGSPFPRSHLAEDILKVRAVEEASNNWLAERVDLQMWRNFAVPAPMLTSRLIRLVSEYTGSLAIVLAVGIVLCPDLISVFFLYAFAANAIVITRLFPLTLMGGGHARFLTMAMPPLLALLAHQMERVSERCGALRSPRAVAASVLLAALSAFAIVDVSRQSIASLAGEHGIRDKLAYLARRETLRTYLGHANAGIADYLNKNLTPESRVLYLFQAQGIYAAPQLYMPTVPGGASIIYRTRDKSAIMRKLKEMNIEYLCLADIVGIHPNNPFLPMVADIATPIFEPSFFARHFVPVETGIKDFYMFRIDYDGLKRAEDIDSNFRAIAGGGFFKLIDRAIFSHKPHITELRSAGYSLGELRRAYEEVRGTL